MFTNQRTALVTGGARGIGAEIVRQLKSNQVHVTAPTRKELDLAKKNSVEQFIKDNPQLKPDILINNAGINPLMELTQIDPTYLEETISVNLYAAVRLIKEYSNKMIDKGSGRIVNISSIFSLVTKDKRAAYSMSKAALNALTRSAAVELGKFGILVNGLAPGYVDTDLTRKNNSIEAIRAIEKTIPLMRLATVEEIAKVAVYLASDENTYITGQTLIIDGGFTCL